MINQNATSQATQLVPVMYTLAQERLSKTSAAKSWIHKQPKASPETKNLTEEKRGKNETLFFAPSLPFS